MTRFFAVLSILILASCSSIVEGTSQEIEVTTVPAGASCNFMRENQLIGQIPQTPGMLKVEKTKHDITIVCNKPGYKEASYFNKSDIAGMTVGNVILGGGIGWAIDSATGADNKYTTPVNINLEKN